jgi:signal-transduction protein with cAMP-binding, CBS, and nucleotidyltransferase domain
MKTAEEILQEKRGEMICVSPDTVICEALKVMTENHIGAILVKQGEKIMGVWTERDLMKNCLGEGFDPKKDIIGDYMHTELVSAEHTENTYELMDKFLGKRMRHLLIEKDGKYIGFLSSGDVMRAVLAEKDQELKQLNAMVGWEYYENWRWEKTRIPPVIHNKEGLRVDV